MVPYQLLQTHIIIGWDLAVLYLKYRLAYISSSHLVPDALDPATELVNADVTCTAEHARTYKLQDTPSEVYLIMTASISGYILLDTRFNPVKCLVNVIAHMANDLETVLSSQFIIKTTGIGNVGEIYTSTKNKSPIDCEMNDQQGEWIYL